MEPITFIPIVKPVGGSCNLTCSYCYFKRKIGGKSNVFKVMGRKTLKALIDFTCQDQLSVEFIWHGGEPLLAGIDFYQQAVEFEAAWSQKGREIRNSVQTNGTLINEQWVSFFMNNNFTIGLSLDGPPNLHDLTRKFRNGKASSHSVVKSLHLVREAGILTDVICCVSSANYQYPLEILDYLISIGIRKYKFLQVQGRDNCGTLLPGSISGEQYAHFLFQVFKRWLELDNPEIEIREIKSIVNLILGGDFRECMFAGECHKYFTVYPDGSIYGCDSLPKIEALCFGHVDGNLSAVQLSTNFSRFCQKEGELRQKCRRCKWFSLCRGGCLQDWYPDIFNTETRNLFCKGLRRLFTEIERVLTEYQLI